MVECWINTYAHYVVTMWAAAWPWGEAQSSLVEGGGYRLYRGRGKRGKFLKRHWKQCMYRHTEEQWLGPFSPTSVFFMYVYSMDSLAARAKYKLLLKVAVEKKFYCFMQNITKRYHIQYRPQQGLTLLIWWLLCTLLLSHGVSLSHHWWGVGNRACTGEGRYVYGGLQRHAHGRGRSESCKIKL